MLKLLFPPSYLPFTYPWIIKKLIKKGSSLLDVGCGDGEFMTHISKGDSSIKLYGVDLFTPYVTKAKKTNSYRKIYRKDVRRIKFPNKSFDIVMASQVIEHLKKKESLSLIKKMENIAIWKVIVGTPNGYFPRGIYERNDLQKHKSYWYVKDFNKLGYKTFGQGLKFIYGKKGLVNSYIGRLLPIRLILFVISYILSPVTYYFPEYSAHLIAVKEVS
ncbi:MAG: Methyltransferase type 11 [Candidatus Woesebacteria bacterium GW2011_GWA1_39_21b]|uniref:Methyltransferase type 11 n=2 Tax=Candidatus Woeseibacteriota TaxID=1752722 RepID=A0A0G0NCX3_9BACT|nr:MAG: Methyltransferase type 11 [Microgenomates group bacterium GW2011_GWC1_38_12]KKR14019.1 MAG: Methyltransferase type 11 [Candidatus Woesebacteria bacterium GW2011_GWA1_39_21b]OGM65677.1 MAG: hypothetical protein A3A52_02195 [Candidatus Woesebacteria bacterium RIFCSPLOWO2_01_FULL_39_14]